MLGVASPHSQSRAGGDLHQPGPEPGNLDMLILKGGNWISLFYFKPVLCMEGQGFHSRRGRAASPLPPPPSKVDLGTRPKHPWATYILPLALSSWEAIGLRFRRGVGAGAGWQWQPPACRTLGPAPAHFTTASLCQPALARVCSQCQLGFVILTKAGPRRRNRRLSLWLCWPDQGSSLTHKGSHALVLTLGTQGHTLHTVYL